MQLHNTLGWALATRSLALETATLMFAGTAGREGEDMDTNRAAENIRHLPDTWGKPILVTLPMTPVLPAHVGLLTTGAPEGVILTAVCHCGARQEILIVSPWKAPVTPLDGNAAGVTRELARAVEHVGANWARKHQVCHSVHARPSWRLSDSIPVKLLSIGQQILEMRLGDILRGQPARPRLGLVLPCGKGFDVLTYALATGNPQSSTEGFSLGEAQFALREIARQRETAPAAAFLLLPVDESQANGGLKDDVTAPMAEGQRVAFEVTATLVFATQTGTVELDAVASMHESQIKIELARAGVHGEARLSPVTGLLARALRPDRLR